MSTTGKFLIYLIILFAFKATLAQSEFIFYDESNSQPGHTTPVRQIPEESINGITIQWDFPGLWKSDTWQDGEKYQHLFIEGFGHLQNIGKPSLPVHSDLLAVPLGAEVAIEILEMETSVIMDYLIYPALKPARETVGFPSPEFEIDEAFYAEDRKYPAEPVHIIDIQEYKGHSMALVSICPVQYNPAKKELILISNIKYRIHFKGGKSFLSDRKMSETFLTNYPNYVLNKNSLQGEIEENRIKRGSGSKDVGKNYIIITHLMYEDAAKLLANWKRQLGYSVEIDSRNYWTSQDVKDAIYNRYASWDPKPDYFAILGDHPLVPGELLTAPDGGIFASDLYYACMDGPYDFTPDLGHGRGLVQESLL